MVEEVLTDPVRVTVLRGPEGYFAEVATLCDGEIGSVKIPGHYPSADLAGAEAVRHVSGVRFLFDFVKFFFLYGVFMATIVGSADLSSRIFDAPLAIFEWGWIVIPGIVFLGIFSATSFAGGERKKRASAAVVTMGPGT